MFYTKEEAPKTGPIAFRIREHGMGDLEAGSGHWGVRQQHNRTSPIEGQADALGLLMKDLNPAIDRQMTVYTFMELIV